MRAWFLVVSLLLFFGGSAPVAQEYDLVNVRSDSFAALQYSSTIGKLYRYGNQYFSMGDYERAYTTYQKAVIFMPTDWGLKLTLGHALIAYGDYAYAAYALRRGISLHPDQSRLEFDFRQIFPTEERYRSVLERVLAYVSANPFHKEAYFVLGYVHYFSGEEEKAREAFMKLLRLDPHDKYAEYFLDRIALKERARKASGEGTVLAVASEDTGLRRVGGEGPFEAYRRALEASPRPPSRTDPQDVEPAAVEVEGSDAAKAEEKVVETARAPETADPPALPKPPEGRRAGPVWLDVPEKPRKRIID